MAKLSNYQQKTLDDAKHQIDNARACETVYEYVIKHAGSLQDRFKYHLDDYPELLSKYTKWWNEHKSGIVLVNSNIRTIQKLEQLGLIKVVKVEEGRHTGYVLDRIQVLNY